MDGAREHFLAGAGLAGQQDREGRGRYGGQSRAFRPSVRRPRGRPARRRALRPATARRAASLRGGSGRGRGLSRPACGWPHGAAVVERGAEPATISHASSRWRPSGMTSRPSGCAAAAAASLWSQPSASITRGPVGVAATRAAASAQLVARSTANARGRGRAGVPPAPRVRRLCRGHPPATLTPVCTLDRGQVQIVCS